MIEFSFIVPLYNCEKYLKQCVDNIIVMPRNDYEIILVNDGSQDNTGKLCHIISQEYDQIRYFHQSNQGVSRARNIGLNEAVGNYVIFLDADDSFDTEKMSTLLDIVLVNPGIDMAIYGVSFDYYYKQKCYRSDSMVAPLNGIVNKQLWIKELTDLYDTNALSPLWNKVIKRKILVDNRLNLKEDMFLYEDLEFSIHCMAFCNNILFSKDIIYHYRQSEDEGNAGRRLKRIQHLPDLIDKIEVMLDFLNNSSKSEYDLELAEKYILFRLYLVLAREKIAVSGRKDIQRICDEFQKWVVLHGQVKVNDEYYNMLVNGNVKKLVIRKYYSALRHKIAVAVKNSRWWRGR